MTISFSVLSQFSPIEINIRNILGQQMYKTNITPKSRNINWTWHSNDDKAFLRRQEHISFLALEKYQEPKVHYLNDSFIQNITILHHIVFINCQQTKNKIRNNQILTQ